MKREDVDSSMIVSVGTMPKNAFWKSSSTAERSISTSMCLRKSMPV